MPASSPDTRHSEGAVRDAVIRLSRPDGEGGAVIERAAILAEGSPAAAIEAWVISHGGEPEVPTFGAHAPGPLRPPVRDRWIALPTALRIPCRGAGIEPMTDKPTQPPLRGEAAWRAEKQEIAKRNDAARAEGIRQRASKVGARPARSPLRRQAAKPSARAGRGARMQSPTCTSTSADLFGQLEQELGITIQVRRPQAYAVERLHASTRSQ